MATKKTDSETAERINALLRQAGTAFQQGRLAEAESLCRKILRLDTQQAVANHMLGIISARQGKPDQAIQYLLHAIENNPGEPSFYNNLVTVLQGQGRLGEALETCDRMLVVNPDHAGGQVQRCNILTALGRPGDALVSCDKALACIPGSPGLHTCRGNILADLGRSTDALLAYERALAIQPDLAEAHNNRGNVLKNLGRLEEALAAFERALDSNPGLVEVHLNRGNVLSDLDRPEEALAAFERLLAGAPEDPGGLLNCASVLKGLGRLEEALEVCGRLTALMPGLAEAHLAKGNVLAEQGSRDVALAAFERALELNPGFAEAHLNRGNVLRGMGRLDEALVACSRAAELKPGFAEAHTGQGNVLLEQVRLEEALAAYEAALLINPGNAEVQNFRGNVLVDLDRLEEALVVYDRALEINPGYAESLNNRGNVLADLGRLQEARAAYDQALRINPEFADAHFNLARLLLLAGDFEKGWKQHEWRFSYGIDRRNYPYPRWQGEPLHGRTVLVYAEQGIGDEIMFASCLADVISGARHCIIDCEPRLAPLFRRSFPEATVEGIHKGAEPGWTQQYEPIDYQVPIGCLPLYTRKTIGDYPVHSGYLVADNEQTEQWKRRCSGFGKGLKVGISWYGGNDRNTRRRRSIPLAEWAHLLTTGNVHFINLQYGDCSEEVEGLERDTGIGIYVLDDIDPLKDMDSFAGLVSSLDLVISVDNSTVHLAGSLGIPAWVLLPFAPDWRWRRDCEDSYWYPGVRLFRQESSGDWAVVFNRLRIELGNFDA